MAYLPLPNHNDPDIKKYNLQAIFGFNLVMAKMELVEIKRKNRILKHIILALILALSVSIGAGLAIYTTKLDYPKSKTFTFVSWEERHTQLR